MQALSTLEDVARRAGTSVATAGRALGGYGKVAPVTRDRIVGAARELNYYANALARSMKQRSGLTIGFESAFFRHGYKVIVCNTANWHHLNSPEIEEARRSQAICLVRDDRSF
jgi:DNA-binding LacI/PurR family transcriptional regulator